jgi:hypothetical protein
MATRSMRHEAISDRHGQARLRPLEPETRLPSCAFVRIDGLHVSCGSDYLSKRIDS